MTVDVCKSISQN